MKTIRPWMAVMTATVIFVSSVNAGHYNPRERYERHDRISNQRSANWVIPLVVGGVLGYALSEPRRESVAYVQSAPVMYAPQPIYQEQWVYFNDCDCQRKVLVRVR